MTNRSEVRPRGHEYRGFVAAYWDLLRGDTSRWPDRAFFRWVIARSGQPALDVGCGTGRLLLDYLGRGIEIEGVDLSPEMLSICRRKAHARGLAPVLYAQAMEKLCLPRSYRTILVPSSSFQLVTDLDAAHAALGQLRAHLLPGGTLAMSIMDLDKEAHDGTWRLAGEAETADGVWVRRYSRATYDPAARLEHTEDRYELVREGAVISSECLSRSPATRSYRLSESIGMLEEAGFTAVRALSGFSLRPATESDRLFCLLARRPF